MCYYVTTARMDWGKGETLNEAMQNAQLRVETLQSFTAECLGSHLDDVANGEPLDICNVLQWSKTEYTKSQKDAVPKKIRFHVTYAPGWTVATVDGMGYANWERINKGDNTEFNPIKLQLAFNTKTGEITADK